MTGFYRSRHGPLRCPLTAPVAIGVGVEALRRIARGEAAGKGMAIAGIVLGALAILSITAFVLVMIWWFHATGDCYQQNYTSDQMDACIQRHFSWYPGG